ncbi:MAG: SEC-C metal-binding domain-containing protein, partial [Actinomycetota bacterium]|nr:SEC-C metal-binding domain-containing protein [Actinomycetota bacterium]
FQAMMESIKEEAVGFLFHVEVQAQPGPPVADPAEVDLQSAAAAASLADGPAGTTTDVPGPTEPAEIAHDHGPPQAPDARPHLVAKGLATPRQPKNLSYSAPSLDGDAGTQVETAQEDDIYAGVSRNELCPCGSGRKFKRCHGDPARRNA